MQKHKGLRKEPPCVGASWVPLSLCSSLARGHVCHVCRPASHPPAPAPAGPRFAQGRQPTACLLPRGRLGSRPRRGRARASPRPFLGDPRGPARAQMSPTPSERALPPHVPPTCRPPAGFQLADDRLGFQNLHPPTPPAPRAVVTAPRPPENRRPHPHLVLLLLRASGRSSHTTQGRLTGRTS